MPSFAHERLQCQLLELEVKPDNEDKFAAWLRADRHLSLLRQDTKGDELILYGSGTYSFVQSVLVDKSILTQRDKNELLGWSGNPFDAVPSYEVGSTGCWIAPGDSSMELELLQDARALVIGRMSSDRTYFEILQEFLQVSNIHWYEELRSYGKYDEQGDMCQVVSLTQREEDPVTLITCRRAELDTYLEATHAVLVRLFDFFLFKAAGFGDWAQGTEKICEEEPDSYGTQLLYRHESVEGEAAYARGGQIVYPRQSTMQSSMWPTVTVNGVSTREYMEFLAFDWRNNRIVPISTDPAATTNYFKAHGNTLPFELSPAFFHPEVLLRYKGDTEKYKIESSIISCRDAWQLRGFGFNEANQVHVYICDLRNLPYREQQYWQIFNEEPKTSLSQSTIETDFQGEFPSSAGPLSMLKVTLRRWDANDVEWWKLRDNLSLERINVPYSGSKDEWGFAFLELAKIVIEGFDVETIRHRLGQESVEPPCEERSIKLLERLLPDPVKLQGLRTVNKIRNKAVVHAGSREGEQLVRQALAEHQTLARHFESVCSLLTDEAERIEKAVLC